MQEPVLFPASVRSNVDPSEQASDEAVVIALQKVGMRDGPLTTREVAAVDAYSVLGMVVNADSLSHGHRLLFCLAQAMLEPGMVLILDEPTSRSVSLRPFREKVEEAFVDVELTLLAQP